LRENDRQTSGARAETGTQYLRRGAAAPGKAHTRMAYAAPRARPSQVWRMNVGAVYRASLRAIPGVRAWIAEPWRNTCLARVPGGWPCAGAFAGSSWGGPDGCVCGRAGRRGAFRPSVSRAGSIRGDRYHARPCLFGVVRNGPSVVGGALQSGAPGVASVPRGVVGSTHFPRPRCGPHEVDCLAFGGPSSPP